MALNSPIREWQDRRCWIVCASTGIGAAVALAEVMKAKKIPGRLVVWGAPAEEIPPPVKAIMYDSGCFKDVDATIMFHGGDETTYRRAGPSGIAALGELASASRNHAVISSMCVVFAETEIVGLLASGRPAADIVAGVQAALTTRVAAMAGRGAEPPICFTGGVALIPGMDHALAQALGQPLAVAPDPMLTGALGAALLAGER